MSNYPYEYARCLDMDQMEESSQAHFLEGFIPLLTLHETCGALLIILVIIWTSYYRDGFSWTSNPQLEFNWHPLLMTIGLVFLYANAMLIYRTQRNVRKRRLKLTHAGMMLFIVLLTVIALVAVFDSHNLASPKPVPNMYTLHSWVGLTTVILFCCQWVAGCISYLFPGLQSPLRSSYMPIHVYFGIATFIGAIASCLLGLNEKAIFTLKYQYQNFVGEGILINCIGLLFISFGGLSVYLVTQERYRRLPRPEDDVLLSR
ncbi:cytochrome b reductase 1-like isoform X1 [Formica exsecta]|uniref:cytochrome b reductase 1-like isoform X1 n=2 Tax=Formica exsecta TaxID=72781 RepID=UPI0011429EC5|nr:cytochrome b reductase 1-like isoform X1 [Formica exsecta]